jgi:hypothetical protein
LRLDSEFQLSRCSADFAIYQYAATAGLARVPEFLSTGWILAQFGKRRAQAQKQYREYVRDGVVSRPAAGEGEKGHRRQQERTAMIRKNGKSPIVPIAS